MDYGLDYLDPNMLLKGPTVVDNYHVTDSYLNLQEADSEVDITQGKWENRRAEAP